MYGTEVLKSNLCDYNDAQISVRGYIIIRGHNVTQVGYKNCLLFIMYIPKINGTTLDDTEELDLDLVMPMYNLLEYCSNHSETTGSFQFYSKDESTTFNADIGPNNNNFKSLDYNAMKLNYWYAQLQMVIMHF